MNFHNRLIQYRIRLRNDLLQLYNQYGVLVSTVSVEKTMQIDLHQMHSGLYNVIILDKNKNIVKSQRIIKN